MKKKRRYLDLYTPTMYYLWLYSAYSGHRVKSGEPERETPGQLRLPTSFHG
jgi:hypothetical protein